MALAPDAATFESLAEVDAFVGGRPGDVVRLDGSTVALDRIVQVRPDSLRGTASGAAVSLAMRDVDRIVLPEVGAGQGQAVVCGTVGAAPGLLAALLIGTREGAPEECLVGGVTMSVAGAVAGALLGPRSREDAAVVPITPLSRLTDAPRGGVGVRE